MSDILKNFDLAKIKENLDANHPYIEIPPFNEWKFLTESKAWFSSFHAQKKYFELPFEPYDFLYSPIFNIKIPENASGGSGYYRRGVKKYMNMIKRRETIPPITINFNIRDGKWYIMDGNHRFDAAVSSGMKEIPAIFGIPKDMVFPEQAVSIDPC